MQDINLVGVLQIAPTLLSSPIIWMISFLLPVIYLGGLFTIFSLFAKWNNKRRAIISQCTPAWLASKYFPVSTAKLEYEEISEQFSPEDSQGRAILETALLRRTMEAVIRIMRIREEKPPLQQMVRENIVGEDLLEKIELAEKELELDLQDVI